MRGNVAKVKIPNRLKELLEEDHGLHGAVLQSRQLWKVVGLEQAGLFPGVRQSGPRTCREGQRGL
jgi:hypothetical protein